MFSVDHGVRTTLLWEKEIRTRNAKSSYTEFVRIPAHVQENRDSPWISFAYLCKICSKPISTTPNLNAIDGSSCGDVRKNQPARKRIKGVWSGRCCLLQNGLSLWQNDFETVFSDVLRFVTTLRKTASTAGIKCTSGKLIYSFEMATVCESTGLISLDMWRFGRELDNRKFLRNFWKRSIILCSSISMRKPSSNNKIHFSVSSFRACWLDRACFDIYDLH